MTEESETGERVAVDGIARISRGQLRLSHPLAIPGSFPMRGQAPHGGLDRYSPGSQLRIRDGAWSARHPVRLPGPGLKNRTVARMGAGDHDPSGRRRSRRHQQKGRLQEDCRQQFPLEFLFVVLQWFNLIAENIFSWTFAAGSGYYAKKNVRQEQKP